ncbi:MAG: ATP synthase F1 subunit epsilon [bacterium JZ-2024 1]
MTPVRVVFEGEIESLIVPAYHGFLGVMKGHQDLVAVLNAGPVWFRGGDERRWFAIGGGLLEVFRGRATILAESCEPAEEIDVERAGRALERAKNRLLHYTPGIDRERAERALARAQTRLRVARKEIFQDL